MADSRDTAAQSQPLMDDPAYAQSLLATPVEEQKPAPKPATNSKMLAISFLLLIVVGLGNKVFQKLETIPMYNYPYFLNLLTTFVYIPLSFAYVLPMIRWGKLITPEQRAIPQYKFLIMGVLDGIAALMQSFAVNYIPSGALIILLVQAAIPISMVITKIFLKTKYKIHNYIGAIIVVAGIILVLVPQLLDPNGNNPNNESTVIIGVWCGVMILSCIPMTLSSVYKEKALGELEIDVIYLNAWVSVYQFILSVLLAIPSAYASSLTIQQLPTNIWGGMKCYVGINSLVTDNCVQAPLFVNLYLFFNIGYNILIIMMLKYGGSNLLWLAMTFMVPMGNFAFALPFMPNKVTLRWSDYVGLFVILGGLVIYRFVGYGVDWYLERKKRNLGYSTINSDN